MAITVHGAGCCLLDILHQGADFSNGSFRRLASRQSGDGGLNIGGLVFASDLEAFDGRPIDEILSDLAEGRAPAAENVGGPAIVSLIHTAQLVPGARVSFFGATGTDPTAGTLRGILGQTPVNTSELRSLSGATPATHVFNDPAYDRGAGERLFINQLGVADLPAASALPEDFFQADVVQFGGTALVPPLHAHLPRQLQKARSAGAFTIVNTVYDFRSERDHPGERWTLGSDEAYRHIDLLICDLEESRRLSGRQTAHDGVRWFLSQGCRAAIVTAGTAPVWYGTGDAGLVASQPVYREFVENHLAGVLTGDTTGCGDNFCGGVVAHVAERLAAGARTIDLAEAVTLGIASGAFCLSYLGGTMVEAEAGEKRARILETEAAFAERLDRKKGVDMEVSRE